MSKLAKKIIIRISVLLIGVIALSLFLNSRMIERYYLHEKKAKLNQISDQLEKAGENLRPQMQEIADLNEVVIAKASQMKDLDALNEELKNSFQEQGLGIEKFWLWDRDYEKAVSNGRQIRIYNQGKLNYSVMVEYLSFDKEFLGIAMVIPNVTQVISLINKVTVVIFLTAAIILIVILFVFIRRITIPLGQIGSAAGAIANQDFQTVQIKTNDEIEELADDINHMSKNLQQSQENMEALLGNVSHDLKTPISLIKAYACGMKDGIDDGTFLDTIICQNERMEEMVKKLLELSKIQQTETKTERISAGILLLEVLQEEEVYLRQEGILCENDIDETVILNGNREDIRTIFLNYITNAIKYAKGSAIHIVLKMEGTEVRLQVENEVVCPEEIVEERLWEPFYVGEESRNKELSGTGLGLSMVRTIAQKHGYQYGCELKGNNISFWIYFETKHKNSISEKRRKKV